MMRQIKLDAATAHKLHQLGQSAELCDPSGKVLEKFVPILDSSLWEPISAPASETELDRREQAKEKRYTTAEVMAHLEKL